MTEQQKRVTLTLRGRSEVRPGKGRESRSERERNPRGKTMTECRFEPHPREYLETEIIPNTHTIHTARITPVLWSGSCLGKGLVAIHSVPTPCHGAATFPVKIGENICSICLALPGSVTREFTNHISMVKETAAILSRASTWRGVQVVAHGNQQETTTTRLGYNWRRDSASVVPDVKHQISSTLHCIR
ncbi:uncharacterized protein H6S33_005755 [Morchella sextelata]|uniref:uncharacterized protein n=1 Tax=Morchella sextelata TaxID=1174677 RepID=UPI001D038DE7|nr:uncharacterized protein H6S33_005755 [Morchella sextelata]KAH0613869.1 hypothetical protein H6S33_005755 [Morchella sextelata]